VVRAKAAANDAIGRRPRPSSFPDPLDVTNRYDLVRAVIFLCEHDEAISKRWLLSRGDGVYRTRPGRSTSTWVSSSREAARLKIGSAIDGAPPMAPDARVQAHLPGRARAVHRAARGLPPGPRTNEARPIGVDWAGTLVGSSEGTIALNVADVQSSILKNASGQSFGTTKDYPITTIDKLVEQKNFPKRT